MEKNKEFFNRRLHSLLGVLPVGLFLVQHLTVNHYVTTSGEAFNTAANVMANLPYRYALEIFVIFLPLLFHAIYGLYIAFSGTNNTSKYGYFRNWMFVLQRVTGVLTLIFVVWHVWQTRIAAMMGTHVDYEMMSDVLSSTGMMVFYLVGVIATVFHFANGLWSFCITWGITVTPRSQLISTYVTMAIFLALTVVSVQTILAFAY